MIQNILELWYWMIALAVMAGVAVYFAVCYVRDLWEAIRNRSDDEPSAALAGSIAEPYSRRMVAVHWLTLGLVVTAWYLGDTLVDERNEKSATMAGYLAHALVGGAVLVATIMRMIYRSMDRLPPPASHSLTGVIAKEIHHALYTLLVLLPLSGFMTLLTSDVGAALVTIDAKLLPEKYTGPSAMANATHDVLMTALMAVAAVHILGALWHQLILKDGLMGRMSLRRKNRRPG